eukprot:1145053-Pelagomonas_calceolata.AAC.2
MPHADVVIKEVTCERSTSAVCHSLGALLTRMLQRGFTPFLPLKADTDAPVRLDLLLACDVLMQMLTHAFTHFLPVKASYKLSSKASPAPCAPTSVCSTKSMGNGMACEAGSQKATRQVQRTYTDIKLSAQTRDADVYKCKALRLKQTYREQHRDVPAVSRCRWAVEWMDK